MQAERTTSPSKFAVRNLEKIRARASTSRNAAEPLRMGRRSPPLLKTNLKGNSNRHAAEVVTYKRRRTHASGSVDEVEVGIPHSLVAAHQGIFERLHGSINV